MFNSRQFSWWFETCVYHWVVKKEDLFNKENYKPVCFTLWEKLLQGVAQGSVLSTELWNFADDSTFFCLWQRSKFFVKLTETW